MRKLLFAFTLVAAATSPLLGARKAPKVDLASEMPADARHLKIGDSAPDFSLVGIDGKTYTLADFKDAKVLMVVFLSNHCPYSHAAETRLLPMVAEFKARGLGVVAINPNSPAGLDISELGYSKYNDTLPEMKLYAAERGFTFPYLYDGDTQKTAKAYGCVCTPHVFLFDQDRKLRYMGRVDDSPYAELSSVTKFDCRDALSELLDGKPVTVAVTKPFGCATKWIENKANIAKIAERWESTPVTLEKIDDAGIRALMKNDTKQLRMINVWATWCVPCVEEFPNLVSLIRQMQNRNFELITITVDDPKMEPQALKFLQKQHAALPNRVKRTVADEGRTTDNYLYTGKITDLQNLIDPGAFEAVPHTVIVAPGGKIVYRKAGPIDLAEVRSKLIDQLSPYYNIVTNN